MIKKIALSLTILISIIACSQEAQIEPVDPGLPPEFPHVFMGNAYVEGEPIKQGVTIYAKFGESLSQFGETISGGRYVNVLVAPNNSEETKAIVSFYMKTEDGEVKAKETYKLQRVVEPNIVNLELNFNSYP
tara:strand:+ start:63 stop:458 length:396 start_codon:yes stop_codon:yes gene_type:complete